MNIIYSRNPGKPGLICILRVCVERNKVLYNVGMGSIILQMWISILNLGVHWIWLLTQIHVNLIWYTIRSCKASRCIYRIHINWCDQQSPSRCICQFTQFEVIYRLNTNVFCSTNPSKPCLMYILRVWRSSGLTCILRMRSSRKQNLDVTRMVHVLNIWIQSESAYLSLATSMCLTNLCLDGFIT